MPEYYKVDSRKITFREYWNLMPSWKVIIPWGAKIFHIPMKFGSGHIHHDSVRELEIEESAFPATAREKLQPLLDQCLQLGCHSPRFFFSATIRRETQMGIIALQHNSGNFGLRLIYVASSSSNPPKGKVIIVLLSQLSDGTYLVTSDRKEIFQVATGIIAKRMLGATPGQLIEAHQRNLAELAMQNRPRSVQSATDNDQLWEGHERLAHDFSIKRGLYVPLQPDEVTAIHQQAERVHAMAQDGVEHAAVLAELDLLREKKAGWGNALLILAISLFFFVGAGSQQWSWGYVLMVVPVLFIHELGHYVAMRGFNYRNLRMFFIPFFGAAVAGQHYNIPGWKKVVVSMMGPIPGIVLGFILGGAGIAFHHPLLLKFAVITLVLNGINLLPMLPLDGGWIFHTLLFSRHYALDAAFRVLAVIALFLVGTLTSNKILLYLGVPMMLGLPTAYRLAKITTALRLRGLPQAAPDDQSIPRETAQAIIGEIEKTRPKALTNKMVAQQTLQVFETLNARPPGWLATSGLLLLQVVSVVLAAAFAFVFMIAQRTDLGAAMAMVKRPQLQLVNVPALVWRGAQALDPLTAQQNTLIATFPSRDLAESSFQSLTKRLPADADIRVFGETLLLALPKEQNAARQEWLGELQRLTKEVFVDNAKFQANISISCSAQNEAQAKEIEQELEDYFETLPTMSLLPPWTPNDSRAPEQIAQHRLARETYLKLQKSKWQRHDDPAIRALRQELVTAQSQGDQIAVSARRQQIKQLTDAAVKSRFAEIRSGSQGPVDVELVDMYVALPLPSINRKQATDDKSLTEIARRMGQLPIVNGQAESGNGQYSAANGGISRAGNVLNLSFVAFNHISDGAPALANWLFSRGCSDMKYGIHPGIELDDTESE